MKKRLVRGISLLSATFLFFGSVLYSVSALEKASSLPVAGEKLVSEETCSEPSGAESYSELPFPVVTSGEVSEESSKENLIEQVVKPPAEIKPASRENEAIEEDVKDTVNTDIMPDFSTTGPALDDTPEEAPSKAEPSKPAASATVSGSSAASSDTQTSSSPASEETSEESSAPERNALEERIDMPNYTPYGKTLTIQVGGITYKADAVVVVSGMVQAEIVGTNTDASKYPYYHAAYQAQAIACHSFVKSYNNRGSVPTGIVVRHPSAATVRLVEQVISKMVYYNGSIAQTLYHASSGLHTQGSQYVWGGTLPYLKGVVSKYDEAPSTVTYSLAETKKMLENAGYDTSVDPKEWFVIQSYSDGNFIDDIKICGKDKTGNTLRSLMRLKSSKAAITFDGETFTFVVNGWGHGVGMSQVGALGYSRYDGWNYTQILTHYYSGCTVK